MVEHSDEKTLRWGILGTGSVSQNFSKDLLIDPASRGQDFKVCALPLFQEVDPTLKVKPYT